MIDLEPPARARHMELQLRFHGESWGWEAQILREGELAIGRRFDLRRLAEQWADEERKHLESAAHGPQ